MDWVEPNVKKIIDRYWNEDKARQFIEQIFLQKDNIEEAEYR